MSVRHVTPDATGAGPTAAQHPLDPLGSLDLFGDDFVRDPYPWLDALRTEAPVYHDPVTGLWLVSRHRDVRRVLLNPTVFLPDNAQHAVTPLPVAALRVLARAGFTLAPALAARIDATGGCDLFASLAQPLPCRVLMELLGIRGVDPATLIRWSDASLELFWGRPTPERQLELAALVGEFHQWLTATVRETAAASDSFIGALARHRLPGGEPLDVETAVSACFFVFIAGQSTTGQLISTALQRALTEPALRPRLAEQAGFAEAWAEECCGASHR